MRQMLATAAIAAAVASGTTWGLAQATSPPTADAAHSSNAAVVAQLKLLNRNIGNSESAGLRGEVDGDVNDLHKDLSDLCIQLGGSPGGCPPRDSREHGINPEP